MSEIEIPGLDNFLPEEPPVVTWEEWLEGQDDKHSFNEPDWFRGIHKGGNRCNFSGAVIKEVWVNNAFAESIDFRGATFNSVDIHEGDFSYGKFQDCTFENCRFHKTILTKAYFDGATFRNCSLDRSNLAGASFRVKEITETVVYGISAWDLEIDEGSLQSKLVIEQSYQFYSEMIEAGHLPLMVDDIELAQFVYYLTNHKKLRNTLDILNQKGVLLLGKFKNGGLERLYHLRDWFSGQNYLPMIFDFERPQAMDYTETVVTMGGLARLVVADLSGPSVPHELAKIIDDFQKPVIGYTDSEPYSMLRDLQRRNPHVAVLKYNGTNEGLITALESGLEAANDSYRAIIRELAEHY